MASRRVHGVSASPGFASGPLRVLARPGLTTRQAGIPAEEADALREAIATAIAELRALARDLQGDAAEMIDFQVAMLEDPALAEAAFEAVARGRPAEAGWSAALAAEIAGYETSHDEYFRARASDLRDIRDRVLARIAGGAVSVIGTGGIVLADDLTPSLFLSTDWRDGGIVLVQGSPASHVAMLARSRGVPMVVRLAASIDDGVSGMTALLDGASGDLVLEPDPADRAAFARHLVAGAEYARAAEAASREPARMADGTPVTVLLNIADPAELETLDPGICDGIGLVRTELLFEGGALPDEDRQAAVYAGILGWAQGRPVTIRTLDAGGDKPIPGLTPEGETNPFLGVRGVRLTLRHPRVFKAQLRALARAAALGPLEVMIPMVSVPHEIEAADALLDEACRELAADGIAHARPPLGIMVEVPAVAVAPDLFEAAFYSIGSNDLVQYTLAAGRDVAELADLATAADPAVLRLVANVVAHGLRTGRKVSLCGDAGGNPRLIPLLLTAGLRSLSMAPADVGRAKLAIASHPGGGAA